MEVTMQKEAESEIQAAAQPGWRGRDWIRDAIISVVIAVTYATTFLGGIIPPTQIGWLKGDAATYYIGWAMFRVGSGLHWPLTYTPAIGYPFGESISLFDNIPLVALLLRPFSPLLPQNFQYLGLYSVVCLILQLYLAVRLLRRLMPDRWLAVWISAIFFLLSPSLTFRLGGHFALSSHWLILAAILLYVRAISGDYSPRGLAWRSAVLIVVAVGINPAYITGMVLGVLVAAAFTAVVKRRITLREGLAVLALVAVSFGISAMAFGLTGSITKDFTAAGYRHFSMNLLAPLNPAPATSPILPAQKTFTNGQYEGYNYLGIGTLALLLLAIIAAVTGRLEITRAHLVAWAPMALCGAWFALMAISTLVTMGDQVLVDLDPSQRLTPYLAAYRASGRLFWLANYLLITFAVVSVVRLLKPRDATVLLATAMALQIYDTQPLRQSVRTALAASVAPASLTSPVWRTLHDRYRNLMIMPPWQCNGDTPGGGDGFRVFGLLAAEQGLTVNSYYGARYRQDSLTFHCNTAIEQLSKNGLLHDSLYVVSPRIAGMIAKGASGPDHCYTVDGFIVCTTSELPGQTHWRESEAPEMAPSVPLMARALTAQDGGYFISGWTGLEPGFGAWTVGNEAVLAYHLPAKPAKSLRLTLLAVTGRNPINFTLVHENGQLEGTIPAVNPPNLQVFTVRLPLGSGPGTHKVSVLVKQLLAPVDQGYNADNRKMGIGVHTISADACPPSSAIDLGSADSPDRACEKK
jgi:hypothetical protein